MSTTPTTAPATTPARPGTRPVQARGQRRRQAILDAALAEFSANGYRTSIATVAAAAGLTDAGLLYHFPTKDDLLLGLIAHHDEQGMADLGALDRDPELTGLDTVRWLTSLGDWMEREPNLMALHVTMAADNVHESSPSNEYFRWRYEVTLAFLTGVFERASEDPEVRSPIDAPHEASTFLALLDGLRLQWFYTDGRVSVRCVVQTYIDALVHRLTTDPNEPTELADAPDPAE